MPLSTSTISRAATRASAPPESDFATPARPEEQPDPQNKPSTKLSAATTGAKDKTLAPQPMADATTVTPNDALSPPHEGGSGEEAGGDDLSKQVRFHSTNSDGVNPLKNDDGSTGSSSKRGLVSKRGRYVSPGRRTDPSPSSSEKNAPTDNVAEYKTYRSPPRTKKEQQKDEVPSLCSTNSGQLTGHEDRKHSMDEDLGDAKKKPILEPTSPGTLNASSAPNGAENADSKDTKTKKEPSTPEKSPKVAADGPGKKKGSLGEHNDENNDFKRSPVPPPHLRDREHYVATPTDFALDYGKGHQVSGSFDTSNVLAWLQSPTGNGGLFSPGGFGSATNTPYGGSASVPRTPRTPTVSTSFFFSDVAKLPRGEQTPGDRKKGNSTNSKGSNNIICISPLASRNRSVATPLNLKDVFASPKESGSARSLPMLSDTPLRGPGGDRPRVPQRSSSKDPSLDAVHLAERELMEDEDLTVLLQLASNNTPRSSSNPSVPVFRSPTKGGGVAQAKGGDNLPGLQLPIIGGKTNETRDPVSSKLKQKSHSGDDETGGFVPPQLEMRSNSGGSKDLFASGKRKGEKGANAKSKTEKVGGPTDLSSSSGPPSHPYGMPPMHHQDMHPYYGMHGNLPHGMPPGTGGSMRVIVGGPPPQRGSKNSPSRGPPPVGGSPHGPPPMYHDYPPAGMPYGPPGMYHQYGGPPHHMGYPYQGHYPPHPPPRHMPMYGSQPIPMGNKGTPGGKRPLDGSKGSTPKKSRKSPGEKTKKKNRSPPITDKAEKLKAQQKIHAINAASGGKNDKSAQLAAAILRGVTMRPSGKWQAQLYFAGKSRYIGVFDTREKAALAYEIAREKLKSGPKDNGTNPKHTEDLVNLARKAAFDGVQEKQPK